MPPNNPDLNPADFSILENLSQRLYKHQRIRDVQHLMYLLEEKRRELPQYEINARINKFRYRLLKVIEVAGKDILNILYYNSNCNIIVIVIFYLCICVYTYSPAYHYSYAICGIHHMYIIFH